MIEDERSSHYGIANELRWTSSSFAYVREAGQQSPFVMSRTRTKASRFEVVCRAYGFDRADMRNLTPVC